MNEQQLAHYENGRMLASRAMWTIELQILRLNSERLEVKDFVMQPLVDFHFLLIALGRLEKAAQLVNSVVDISVGLNHFKQELPWLRKLRNVLEHIDEYQQGIGRNSSIKTSELHVFGGGKDNMHWLGEEVEYKKVLSASNNLFEAITSIST